MRSSLFWLTFIFAVGCGGTGQDEIELPLHVAGTDVSEAFGSDSGAIVNIDRAELAFGPLYLCAGFQAGEACGTARLEWIGSALVHATDPAPVWAGTIEGSSGPVRSWMYDLGLTSLLTRDAPLVMPAAQELGGVSLHVEGRAQLDTVVISFVADLAIAQETGSEPGIPVVRKSTSDVFGHDVEPDEPGLLVRFDPRPWLAGVDFAALCDVSAGCPDVVRIEGGTQAERSVRSALVAGVRPAFEWSFTP